MTWKNLAKRREWYRKNREKILAQNLAYRKKHPEILKLSDEQKKAKAAYWANYYKRNKKKLIKKRSAKHKEKYEANPKFFIERRQQYRDASRPDLPIKRAIKAYRRGDITIDGLIEQSRRQIDLFNGKVRGVWGDSGFCRNDGNNRRGAGKNGSVCRRCNEKPIRERE